MLKTFSTVICAVVLLSTPARASACDQAEDQATLNECAALELRQADSQLNEAYKELRSKFPDQLRPDLVKAQRAWIAFRDAECNIMVKAVETGSTGPMVVSNCLAKVTRQRLEEFRYKLACEAGDFDCVQVDDSAD